MKPTLLILALALCVPAVTYAQLVTVGDQAYFIDRIGGAEIPGAFNDPGDFTQPTWVTQAPGEPDLLYIVERTDDEGGIGRINTFNPVTHTETLFFDPEGGVTSDGGIITIAFHPDYQNNGLFYAVIIENATSQVIEFDANNGFSARTMLTYNHPQNVFHTANWVAFAPGADGAELYVLCGDGGTQANNPSFNPAIIESEDSPFGKLLRLDTTADYSTPVSGLAYDGSGSPLSSDPRVEVVAKGLRNGYRGAFDETGGLFIGDVGFQAVEEINYLSAAQIASSEVEDYGWTSREGSIATPVVGIGGPGSPGDINPIFDYLHNGINPGEVGYVGDRSIRGASLTSGYLLNGRFFFADFVTADVFSGAWNGTTLTDIIKHDEAFASALNDGISFVVSFGTDLAGNLYIIDFGDGFFSNPGTGEIFRLRPIRPGDCDQNAMIDIDDFQNMLPCHLGPDTGLAANCGCFDLDDDGSVTLGDTALFQQGFTGR